MESLRRDDGRDVFLRPLLSAQLEANTGVL